MRPRFWCIVAAAVSLVSLARAGEVKGFVRDAAGNQIPNAEVRLISAAARVVQYRTRTGNDGSFRIEDVQPGAYAIRAGMPGFREELGPDFILKGVAVVEAGSILLQFAGCDAPGVSCDDFGFGPPRTPPIREGQIEVGRNCGVNLDEGTDKAICRDDKRIDLWFHVDSEARLELKPGRSAALSPSCKNTEFKKDALLVGGRGPGSQVCILTKNGHHSFVYVEEEVSNTSPSIKLYYVTYK